MSFEIFFSLLLSVYVIGVRKVECLPDVLLDIKYIVLAPCVKADKEKNSVCYAIDVLKIGVPLHIT